MILKIEELKKQLLNDYLNCQDDKYYNLFKCSLSKIFLNVWDNFVYGINI